MASRANRSECIQEIGSLLEYDPKDGILYWAKDVTAHRVGDKVKAHINNCGYLTTSFRGLSFTIHRLVWLVCKKEYPPGHIDHINQDKLDNRIENLRAATHSQNMHNSGPRRNNKLGTKGICWIARDKMYVASIYKGGEKVYCRYFKTLEEATSEYKKASKFFHGEFSPCANEKLSWEEMADLWTPEKVGA